MNEMIVAKINEATGNFGITVMLLSAIIAVINILLKEITKDAPISGITGIMTKGAEGEEINKQDIKKMVRYSVAQIIKILWFLESISILYSLCYDIPDGIGPCKFFVFDDLTQTTKSMVIPIAFAIIGFILSNFGNYKKLFEKMLPSALGLALTIVMFSLVSRVLTQSYFLLTITSQTISFTYAFITWCIRKKNPAAVK